MRPTDLHFRSPREKTAEFLYPRLTSDGHHILLNRSERSRASFSKSPRFPQYESNAKKTGYRVGPGAYELGQSSIGKAYIKGTPGYHSAHGGKDLANNGYIFVGNSILFDPAFINKKSVVVNHVDLRVDASQVLKSSPEKSKKSFTETTDSFKKVPWYMKANNTQNEFLSQEFMNNSFSGKKNKKNNQRVTKRSPVFD